MNQETEALVLKYAEHRDPEEAVKSLAYLCRMLWLRRSDKLHCSDYPILIGVTNSVLENSEAFSHLPLLPSEEKAYRMNGGDIYFKDASHSELEREVIKVLRGILMPPKPKTSSLLNRICHLFK